MDFFEYVDFLENKALRLMCEMMQEKNSTTSNTDKTKKQVFNKISDELNNEENKDVFKCFNLDGVLEFISSYIFDGGLDYDYKNTLSRKEI